MSVLASNFIIEETIGKMADGPETFLSSGIARRASRCLRDLSGRLSKRDARRESARADGAAQSRSFERAVFSG